MCKIKVSVVVLTCNRKRRLIKTLANVASQSLGEREIIVVDNGSTDGTYEEVKKRFPSVRLLRMRVNRGCAGRNTGIQAAEGEIVVTLDDDVYFKDKKGLEKVLNRFSDRNVDVACFKIWDYAAKKLAYNNWYHPREIATNGDLEFETDYISEGAVAFRRSLFDRVGYYSGVYFLGHEGYDLALRIINGGYRIIYCPSIEVVHAHSSSQRKIWRGSYYHTRNTIWLFVRNYPLASVAGILPYKVVTRLLFSLSPGQIIWYLKGLFDGVKGIPGQLRHRKPLTQKAMGKLRAIRREQPGLVCKVGEFCEKNKLRRELRRKRQ